MGKDNTAAAGNTLVNSLLGQGSVFKGDIRVNGMLRLDGDFTGTIVSTGKVFISETARVESSINASSVVVGGVVKGDITATDKVTVLSTGMVVGDIRTARLVAEEGVVLDGNCFIFIEKEKKPAERKLFGKKTEPEAEENAGKESAPAEK